MITVFGFEFPLPAELQFLGNVYGSFIATLLAWLVIDALTYVLFTYALRRLTRRLPGEVDDIVLHVVRRPLLVLIFAYGVLNSLRVFETPSGLIEGLERVLGTVVILAGAWLAWRVLKDIVVYYGESAVRRTESKVDDVLLPVVNAFGALLVIIVAALLILPLWGINVTSVLLGAGVLGLVLGLALQDTLANIFGGISLLADAPFRIGDLVVLSDGKVCRVDRIGLRATQLYYLDEHSEIFVPNKLLTSERITNITKPTVDLRITLDVRVPYGVDLPYAEEVLREIGISHPNLLVSDLPKKIARVSAVRDEMLAQAEETPAGSPERAAVLSRIEKYQQAIERLSREHTLDQEKQQLEQSLEQLGRDIRVREAGGFTDAELKELYQQDESPLEALVQRTIEAMQAWSEIPDPWAEPAEVRFAQAHWQRHNDRLRARWHTLRQALLRPRDELELRLDDMTEALVTWLRDEYKYTTEPWKDPSINFIAFGQSGVELRLAFYLDDIRLEHLKRRTRVLRELGNAIHERFRREGIDIPYPQTDVFFKNTPAPADGRTGTPVTIESSGLGRRS